MFGLLISGRLVDTNFREVDATHAVIDVMDADNFNHVVVSSIFMLTIFINFFSNIKRNR